MGTSEDALSFIYVHTENYQGNLVVLM